MATVKFYQGAYVLNQMYSQMTGSSTLAVIDTSSFISVATTVKKMGNDAIMNALSDVLTRTKWSVRRYGSKFAVIMKDAEAYGNHIRKINAIDRPVIDNAEYTNEADQGLNPALTDMWEKRDPIVVQTNFYDSETYSDCLTVYEHQINTALEGPAQWQSFLGFIMETLANKHEQFVEDRRRLAVLNLITGTTVTHGNDVYYLITEYNNATGSSLTVSDWNTPANFPDFARWLFGFIGTLSEKFTERGYLHHFNPQDGGGNTLWIARHTPKANQKAIFIAGVMKQIQTRVKATTYNADFLEEIDHELTTYWQSSQAGSEMSVTLKPNYVDIDGVEETNPSTVSLDNVFGLLFDEEAVGETEINVNVKATPVNAKASYYNLWYHWTDRLWNDFTENCAVLLIDEDPNP